MKNKIMILIFVLLLTSCGFRGTTLGGINERSVHTGTNGLVINFLETHPINRISEQSEFRLDVESKNEGSSEIIDGRLYLGLEEEYMESVYDNSETIALEGKSRSRPIADSEIKTFVIETKELEDQSESLTTNMYVTACYGYRTEAAFTVCVDPKYNELVTEKACEVKSLSSSGQGGPVAVTKVEPKMLGFEKIKPQFILTVENKGNGEVIASNKIADVCSYRGLDSNDINIVGIRAFLSEVPLKCEPMPIKLRGKEDFVRCTLEDGIVVDEPAYTTLLTVFLDYGYTTSISKEVVIEKLIY